MAELHVWGQLLGANHFPLSSLFCKWSVDTGSNFRLLEGTTSGQTHCDDPHADEMAVWAHPIDMHYSLKGVDGWPRLQLEVWGVDQFGRCEIAGYGCCFIPASPGTHELRCPTWRPSGTLSERLSTFFLGGGPMLKHKQVVTASTDRYRLNTEASGEVYLQLAVMTKDFARFGVSS